MASLTKSKAKKKAWAAFSLYIRMRGASGGQNRCVTCGRSYNVTGRGVTQAGHFIPGRKNSILFEETNCHPQCYGCNVMKKGNMVKYYKFMLDTYGQAEIDRLDKLSNETVIFSVQDYLDIEAKYKAKLAELTK
jgi:hypothetical protein